MMQQLCLNGWIGVKDEPQAALWSSESADALDETPATGAEAYELPPKRALFGGRAGGFVSRHLHRGRHA